MYERNIGRNESRTKSRANLENSVVVIQRPLLQSTVSISRVTPQHIHRGLADREKLGPAHAYRLCAKNEKSIIKIYLREIESVEIVAD